MTGRQLPPIQAEQLQLLLSALDGIQISEEQRASLIWLAQWDRSVVADVAALIRQARLSTSDLRAVLIAAGWCDVHEQLPLDLADLEYFGEHGTLPEGVQR